MKREEYNNFINGIKTELLNFLFKYEIPFDCKFPQNENDDSQYTIDLGEELGKVNVLFESYNNLPKNEVKSNTFTICILYQKLNVPKTTFNFDCGAVNDKDGTFILFSSENGLEGLKNDFKSVLKIWSEYQVERNNILAYHSFCPN